MAEILVVDPNEAFATLLVEELQQRDHEVISASSFEAAVTAAESTDFDLALVDMGVAPPGAVALAQELRSHQRNLRLVFIPMIGEDLPDDVRKKVPVQGVLPKPFFLPELPERIDAALMAPIAELSEEAEPKPSAPVEEQPVLQTAEAPTVKGAISVEIVAEHRREIERLMDELAQEVGADVVLLSVGGHLSASVGHLDVTETQAMAQAVDQSWAMSTEVGRILGREHVRFEQSISGGDYVLYALSIDGPTILAVAIQGAAMLGLLRHRARGTADAIAALCMT